MNNLGLNCSRLSYLLFLKFSCQSSISLSDFLQVSRFSPYEWQGEESDEEDETVPASACRRAPPTSYSEDPHSPGIPPFSTSSPPHKPAPML